MGYKEWESDEFLDEFLDFDYRKPVPDHRENASKGLPAEKAQQNKQPQKGLGLEDDLRSYSEQKNSAGKNAGERAFSDRNANDLRSSDAFRTDIPEPFSGRKSEGDNSPKAAGIRTAPAAPEAAANASAPVKATGTDSTKPKKRMLFNKSRASEFASEALGVARKLVSTEEDEMPEVIPASAQSGEDVIDGMRKGRVEPLPAGFMHSGADDISGAGNAAGGQQGDELADLFAELGETANHTVLSADENVALAQAQQDAYDRYRENYVKGIRKKLSSSKVGWFPKWVSRLYVVVLAVFVASMTIMNVLPFGMLIAFYVILGLLSLIILMQLRRERVRKWTRVLASATAVLLILCFGVGSAYAMGTLSFLDFTSVENEKRVASVTREPFNVCFTGIDVYGKIDKQGRSDVNMIVTINPNTEQILLTSIPRDYEIYMPDKDYAMDKLTHTGFYSVDTTIAAEENLLETEINYYVKVNFTTVKGFIYSIGGIDVYSEYEFTPVKRSNWTVKKGWNHMDGKQALAFARERKAFVDGDNQRIKNQQAVFEAIIRKATSSKTMVISYNKILTNLRDYFQMSFSSRELRSLIKLQLARNPQWKIYKNTIVGGNGSMPTYSTGSAYAYVMTQDPESIENAKSLINGVLQGKTLDKDDDGNVFVVGEENSGESGEDSGDTQGE